VLMLLKMLKDYLQCLEQLPTLNTDILQRIIDLLQLFNSRTCQLVLGAGAMHLVQLKSITAKHLALASQCLSVQLALIPHIKVHLQSFFPAKKHILLNDFDRVVQDYQAHQQEISQKFVAIMKERVQAHCRTLKAADWSKEEQTAVPTAPIGALVKETATLHKVLTQLLPASQVMQIFENVAMMFSSRLIENFTNFGIPTSGGKKRFLQDISYFSTNLGVFGGSAHYVALEEFLHVQWNETKK